MSVMNDGDAQNTVDTLEELRYSPGSMQVATTTYDNPNFRHVWHKVSEDEESMWTNGLGEQVGPLDLVLPAVIVYDPRWGTSNG